MGHLSCAATLWTCSSSVWCPVLTSSMDVQMAAISATPASRRKNERFWFIRQPPYPQQCPYPDEFWQRQHGVHERLPQQATSRSHHLTASTDRRARLTAPAD